MRLIALAFPIMMLVACAHLTSQDKSEIAEYETQQTACIAAHHGDAPAIARCRADVKARWERQWNERFDGGFNQ